MFLHGWLGSGKMRAWKSVKVSQAPSKLAVESPGRLPQASLIARTSGNTMPPERAATLGMAGARSASLQSRVPYQPCYKDNS